MKNLYIFDMDGVIIDSEPLYRDMNKKLFEELGAVYNEDEYNSFVGIAADKMWQQLKDNYNLEQPVHELKKTEHDKKHLLLKKAKLEPIEGIKELLEQIRKKNHLACIASSSQIRNIKLVAMKVSISHYFDFFISGEDIKKGKPDPDIFIKAAQEAGVSPGHCIVIEDSNNGIIAAKRAGMKCAGFKNENSGAQDLSSADVIIEDFSEENRNTILNL